MTAPDLRRYVAICMACEHWQIDVRPGAVSDLGGAQTAFWALGEAANEHLRTDCVGGPDSETALFEGKRVQQPKMADGKPATGALAMHPLPRWWVTK